MKVLLVLVVVAVAVSQAGKIPSYPRVNKVEAFHPSSRITHGDEVQPHSKPWQVALFTPRTTGLRACSGSLISENAVLTTAQCVEDALDDIRVVLGAHNITENEDGQVSILSSTVIIHEDWNGFQLNNNIALVILPEPAPLSDIIQPIALEADASESYVDEEATVSGWGRVSLSPGSESDVLLEINVSVISDHECNRVFTFEYFHLCTNDLSLSGKSTCLGDNGAPLVLNGTLIGVATFELSPLPVAACGNGLPAGYVRVGEFTSWINEQI